MDLESLAQRLDEIAFELSEASLQRLYEAARDPDDPQAAAARIEERNITRARRAVEKAAHILRLHESGTTSFE